MKKWVRKHCGKKKMDLQNLQKIPFSLLPPRLLWPLARSIRGFGNFIASFFPFLRDDLTQAQVEIRPKEWVAAAVVASAANALLVALVFAVTLAVTKTPFATAVGVVALATLAVLAASFSTIMYYPKIIASRRTRLIENELIPATRHLLVEIRSGVPLFHAMASVSDGYGEASREFKKIVKRIDAGVPEVDALVDATRENASLQFRKVLWQLSNSLKVGSDLGDALDAVVQELVRERVDTIRKYGQELSPWTMIYMMLAIIVPSLGITFSIIATSFLNMTVPSVLLALGIVYLILFQLFYLNFLNSRRPAV